MKPIVFFDGFCYLCNAFVDMVILRDAQIKMQFAPLQGETFKNLKIPEPKIEGPFDTIFFWDGEKLLDRSAAIIEILTMLGGIWSVFKIFKIVPRVLRDTLYRFIAKRRYSWFGKRDSCRIPTPEEKEHFLP